MADPSHDKLGYLQRRRMRRLKRAKPQLTGAFANFLAVWEDFPPLIDRDAREDQFEELHGLLGRLEALESTQKVFDRLKSAHNVDINELLKLLQRHRFEWVFSNSPRMFEGRNLDEVKRWPERLRLAGEILNFARPFLLSEWDKYLGRCTLVPNAPGIAYLEHDPELRTVSEKARRLLHDYTQNGAHKRSRKDASEWLELVEWFETAETCELQRIGTLETSGTMFGFTLVDLPILFEIAIGVLDKARATLQRRDFHTASFRTGRRIFSRGRRLEYPLEVECARELIHYFNRQTKRPLYDYVGNLLMATYPETCGRMWRSKRPRDAVKQLLKSYRDHRAKAGG